MGWIKKNPIFFKFYSFVLIIFLPPSFLLFFVPNKKYFFLKVYPKKKKDFILIFNIIPLLKGVLGQILPLILRGE